jgi:hypothetical protein
VLNPKNDEDEILNGAHQLNHAVQKKIAEATGNSKIESRHAPLLGVSIGQSSFSVARIFVEAFVGD